MPDSRSRRFATWAFSFKPLGGNLRIAAATHISAFLSRKAEIGKERIQQVLPRRRTEIGPRAAAHSADLIRQASRNRERAPPPSRVCTSAKCSTAGATGSEALRETRNSGNPQPGSPLPAKFARPQKLPCKPQPCRDLRGVPQNEDDEDQHRNPELQPQARARREAHATR